MGRSRFAISTVLALVFLSLMYIPPPADAQGGLYGGTLDVAVVGTLDPNPLNRSPANEPLHSVLYDALGRPSPTTLVPEPWLAAGWDVDVLAGSVTFHLRPNAKWGDGTGLTAAHVVATYNRYAGGGIVSGFTATAVDLTTVTFSFTQGGGDFLGKWVTLPIAFDSPTGPAKESGLFRLGPSVPGVSLDVLANPNHWRGRPYLDGIRYEFHLGSSALDDAACDLIERRVDFLGVSLVSNDLTAQRPCGRLQEIGNASLEHIFAAFDPGYDFLHLGMNTARPPLDDPAFRVALTSALDRDLTKQIEPSTVIADSVVTPSNGFWFNASVPQYRVPKGVEGGRVVSILDGVNDLLDRAGYFDRDGDSWRDRPDGTPFTLTFLHLSATDDARIAKVQGIVTNLNTVGVRLNEVELSAADILTRVRADNFDLYLGTHSVESDPIFLFDLFHSSRLTGRNYNNLADPALDAALVALRDELDLPARQQLARDVQGWLGENAAAAPLVHYDALFVYNREDFEGWARLPGGINNFWSFASLHVVPQGPLALTVAPFTANLPSGGSTTVIVTVTDADDLPVEDVDVVLAGGTFSPASGTTDGNGRFVAQFTAPAVTSTTDVSVTASASKPGYDPASASAGVTVHPVVRRFEVSMARTSAVIEGNGSSEIIVAVLDATVPSRPPVAGASVSLSLSPSDVGGVLSAATGTTDSAGEFRATLTARVGTDTTIRVIATVTDVGFESATASTSVLARAHGDPPRPIVDVPALDTLTMVVLVAAAAFLYARIQVRRRKE